MTMIHTCGTTHEPSNSTQRCNDNNNDIATTAHEVITTSKTHAGDNSTTPYLMTTLSSRDPDIYIPPNDGPYRDKMTFVTMFIDLQKRSKDGRRTGYQYIRYAKDFILRLDVPMVLFIEPEYVEEVKCERDRLGFADRTLILPITLEELPLHKQFLDRGGASYFNRPILGMVPPKFSFEYRNVICSKFTMLKRAYEMNPFRTEHFAWIDFGCGHLRSKVLPEIYEPASDRVLIEELIHIKPGDTKDLDTFYGRIRLCFAGTFMRVRGDYIPSFCQLFDDELDRAWSMRYYPLEEDILGVMYDQHRDAFDTPYRGNYHTLFCNRYDVHGGQDYMLLSLLNMREAKEYSLGYEIASSIRTSVTKGHIVLNEHEAFHLLDELFIFAYFCKQQEDSNRVARELLLHMCIHAPKFNHHLPRIRHNLAHY